jgi:hypothetical protein
LIVAACLMMDMILPSEAPNVKAWVSRLGAMRRLLTLAVRATLAVVALAVVRAVLLDRAPHRPLHGADPVIGSLDTWPKVPRRPTD